MDTSFRRAAEEMQFLDRVAILAQYSLPVRVVLRAIDWFGAWEMCVVVTGSPHLNVFRHTVRVKGRHNDTVGRAVASRLRVKERAILMLVSHSAIGRFLPTAGKTGLVVATIVGGLFLSAGAQAQAQQPATPAPKAPPASAGQAQGDKGGSWVKLCQQQKAKDNKAYNICLTHHERFHPTTGQPLISAAIRQIDGQKEPIMMFMVPLGRLLGPGLVIQVDENEPRRIGYSYCTALGCVAQAPVSDEIIGSFKKGSEITVKTVDVGQKQVGFKVPLAGFTRALDGPPIDRKVYAQARKEMFELIRARQVELAKKRAAEAAKNKPAEQPTQQKAPAQPAQPKKLQ